MKSLSLKMPDKQIQYQKSILKTFKDMKSTATYTEALNRRDKYVASATLSEPLPWENSILLSGDVPAAVTALKQQQGKDVVILGSGQLIRSLMAHNLIDEFLLMIHPVVLGSGQRLFADGGAPAAFALVDSTTTTTGVVIATYRLGEA